MGADMYYVYMGDTQYKIVTKFYRDWRGIPFKDPTVKVSLGNNRNSACGTYALTTTWWLEKGMYPVKCRIEELEIAEKLLVE